MKKPSKQSLLLLSSVLAIYVVVFVLYIIKPLGSPLEEAIRFFALFGLLNLAISSIMAAFTREIYKIFGKPFIKIHHIVALTGLGFVILHPILFAIYSESAAVFVPKFDSWIIFWVFAGRVAIYFIIVAVIAGFLQKQIPKFWRYLHGLNYFALVFGFVHGIYSGVTLGNSIALQVIFSIIIALAILAFVFKRYRNYQKKKRIKEKQEKKMKEQEKEATSE